MESEPCQVDGEERAKEQGDRPPASVAGLGLFAAGCFGVFLPILTIGVEFLTGMCADEFLDPIPTWIHLLLACLVPAGNTVALILLRNATLEQSRLLAPCVGASLLASLLFTVIFLPLLPLAVIAIVFAGLGLLPLTPILSFLATVGIAVRVARGAKRQARQWLPGMLAGAAGVVLLLAVAEVPVYLTYRGLDRALSDDPAEELAGIRDLRRFGSESALQSLAAPGPGGAPSFGALLLDRGRRSFPRDRVTWAAYRVTGEDPAGFAEGGGFGDLRRRNRMRQTWMGEPWDRGTWDRHLGSAVIGPPLPGLSLVGSRLDGLVEPPAALAYLEWTLVFENWSNGQQEARGLLRLPPGGAVSRLTMWVEGEEREAAFAARGKVTQAYQRVAIQQRRDPALVTTEGRDQVLLRCFPVPPSGQLKVRVGITAPLVLGEDGGPLRLELPALSERNFASGTKREVWITSPDSLSDPAGLLREEPAPVRGWALRGALPHAEPGDPALALLADGQNPPPDSWTRDYVRPGFRIRQVFSSEPVPPPSLLVVVLDGSRAMRERRAECEALLEALDPSQRVALVLALEDGPRIVDARAELLPALAEVPFVGGIDNSAALKAAWDLAAPVPGSQVFWIHGPEPVPLGASIGLMQRFERHPAGPPIVHAQLVPGPHRLVAELDEAPRRLVAPFAGGELLEHFATIHREREVLVRRLEELEPQVVASPPDHESSGHLVRLWALERIEALRVSDREAAQELAGSYRLVTPVSGAVVLETREQYEESGLDPDAFDGAVPTVPEPGEWALLVVGGLVVFFYGRRRWREARA